jgi:hypothetical protein
MSVATGYFVRVDKTGRVRQMKTHVFDRDTRKCLCGFVPSSNTEFLFCAYGIMPEYITCQHCARRIAI